MSASLREFDPRLLRQSQIAAFADHPGAHVGRIDAQRVVAPVIGFLMGLRAGLDVGADAAVVDQVDRRLEQGADQFGRGQLLGGDVEHLADLRRKRDGFQRPRPDTTAFRDQLAVKIVPRRTRQGEEALAFTERGRRIRVRIEEDVTMIEGCDQPDLL